MSTSAFCIHYASTDGESYKLNICMYSLLTLHSQSPCLQSCCEGDVGGQKTLRSYWRNYFEKTDALIWVVDATDRLRIDDCSEELAGLLLEEVSPEYCCDSGTADDVGASPSGSWEPASWSSRIKSTSVDA